MIDFHCHLDLYPDHESVIEQCDSAGIYVLSMTTTPKAWAKSNSLVKGRKKIRTALGLHPELAHERLEELSLFDYLINETKYVGEIGLDGSTNQKQHAAAQIHVFEHILKTSSVAGGKILSVHSRRAVDDVLKMLGQFPDAGIPVLHWFTGTKHQLEKAIKQGCWFSVGPAMLKSKKGRELVSLMPRNKILPETDGPFVRVKGKETTPLDSSLVISDLSKVWGESIDVTREILLNSFRTICTICGTGCYDY